HAVSIRQSVSGNAPRAEQGETGIGADGHVRDSLVDGRDVRGGEEENPGRVPVQGLDGRPPGAAGLVAVRGRRHRLVHQPVHLRVVGSVFHTLSSASNRPARARSLYRLKSTSSSWTSTPAIRNCSCNSRAYWRRTALVVGSSRRKASGRPSLSRMPSPSESVQPVLVRSRAAWPLS